MDNPITNPITNNHGTERWYNNWQLHREDGPAIIYTDGEEHWYQNGHLHREDGPAIIYTDGIQDWYLNGIKYNFNEYCNELNIHNEDRLLLRIQYD